ncbi:glycosyltransferase family 1 protein [Clostridium perfringens]|nr:glycosyltransferase family 1 protein [Clostridium perfringens]MDK0663152.1 glycosyltransferase family 1 protein [Clostridium perfringens]
MYNLIDARGATWYRGTGIGTYTYNLLTNILKLDKDSSYDLLCSGEKIPEFESENTKIIMSSRKHQRFFEDYYIPSYGIKENIDLLHLPQNGLGLSSEGNFAKLVTIHDLIPYILPETVGKGYLKKFLQSMPEIIDNSTGIITVSEYSKSDILRFFPHFPAENIFVTPLAANGNYKPLDKEKCLFDVNKRFNFNGPFIMYIGGFSLRKNVKGLVDAFNNIHKNIDENYKLLIVGGLRDEGLKLKAYTESLPIKDKVIFTGFIEDEYLPTLYNATTLFVYPSLYEGFGLPPLEAMSCKTAVLTSNITSIPEVVPFKESLVDPNNPKELSLKLENLLNDSKLRNNLEDICFERSKEFTWEKTAKKTLEVYKKVIEISKNSLIKA